MLFSPNTVQLLEQHHIDWIFEINDYPVPTSPRDIELLFKVLKMAGDDRGAQAALTHGIENLARDTLIAAGENLPPHTLRAANLWSAIHLSHDFPLPTLSTNLTTLSDLHNFDPDSAHVYWSLGIHMFKTFFTSRKQGSEIEKLITTHQPCLMRETERKKPFKELALGVWKVKIEVAMRYLEGLGIMARSDTEEYYTPHRPGPQRSPSDADQVKGFPMVLQNQNVTRQSHLQILTDGSAPWILRRASWADFRLSLGIILAAHNLHRGKQSEVMVCSTCARYYSCMNVEKWAELENGINQGAKRQTDKDAYSTLLDAGRRAEILETLKEIGAHHENRWRIVVVPYPYTRPRTVWVKLREWKEDEMKELNPQLMFKPHLRHIPPIE